MFNHHHLWTHMLRTLSLLFLMLGCLSIVNPQWVWGQDSTQKGGGLKGFVDRLLNLGTDPPPGLAKKVPPPSTDPTPPPPSTDPTPPPPTSGSLPGSLTFTGAEGGANPAAQTLSITNTGGGILSWNASESASWLSLSPASGTTTTETDNITVNVSIAGLTANSYADTITLTATGATNPTQQVPVTVTITPPPSTIGQSPTFLTFIAQEGGTQTAPQTLNITNPGKGTLSWSASEAASWLTLSPTSGTTTTGTDPITVTVNTSGLLTNTYTAPITITANGASNTPQQVLATLAITAPASTKATLSWDPNAGSDLTGYKVYVGTASSVYGTPVDVGLVTTFEVINLSKGQTYFFTVTAYNSAGESGYSNEGSKTIP